MARKPQHLVEDLKELAALLDDLSALLERTKVMYEQHFLGIQKMPPAQLHRDLERRLRELTQRQIRNTALRYRLATMTQKFGVYNTYWRRTLRQIEQGRYVRDVARVQRRAQRRGEDVPEEILAAMPKRMRDQVLRDREILAKRTAKAGNTASDTSTSTAVIREQKPHRHEVGGDLSAMVVDDNLDIDALFANLTSQAESAIAARAPVEVEHVAPAAAKPATTPPPMPPPMQPSPPPPVPTQGRRPRAATTPPPIPERARRPHAATTPPPIPEPARSPGRHRPPPPPIPKATPRAPTPPLPVAQPTSPKPPPGMTEESTRALYKRYLQARKSVGKSTDVRYEELVRSLNKQAPVLMERHNAKAVEFDVHVKGDKVILKAKPKPK